MSAQGIRRTKAGIILGSARLPVNFSAGTIEAAGSGQSDAALLLHTVNAVFGANNTKGVVLPLSAAGTVVKISNTVLDKSLKVYPPSGGSINGGTTDAAITMDQGSAAELVCTNGSNWGAIYTAV